MKSKKTIKFTLSLLLLLFFTISTLISCQSSDNNTNNPTQSQSADGQISSVEEESNPPEFTPVAGIDYGGYKFRILGYDGKAAAIWQVAAISEIIAEEEIGEPIHDAVYKRNREIEALYNIEFDIVPVTYPKRDDFADKFTKAVFAGDDNFDAAFVLGMSLPKILSRNNMTRNLSEIPSLDLSKSWWDQKSAEAMSIGGKVNAVIGDMNLYSAFSTLCVFANKQLMKEYAIENLYQSVRDGKWTWDVMYDIMKNVSKDLNGDGKIDKDDQVGLFMQYAHVQTAINCAGEFLTPKNSDDIPVFEPNMDKIAAIASKVIPIFHDNNATVPAEAISGFNNQFFDFIMPKFRDGEIMFLTDQLLLSFELRSMDADFAILPFPKYDENQANYGSMISSYWATFTVIPTTCTNVERTGNILEAMGYYSQKYVMPAYYDITVTNKLMRDDDSLEMMEFMFNNRQFDLAYFYEWGGINDILYNLSFSGKADTIVSQLEKNDGKIQKGIQKTLEELELN